MAGNQITHDGVPARGRRVLVVGPLPPPVHGQALLGELMIRGLRANGDQVESWHIVGASETADIGANKARKALRLLAEAPRQFLRIRRFRPDAVISTIGIGDSVAVALRDCLVPRALKTLTGATTAGYMCGMTGPVILASRPKSKLTSRLLGLFDTLIEPYPGCTAVLDPALDAIVIPYCAEPPADVVDPARAADRRARARTEREVGDALVVVFMAHLIPEKGATVAIEAVAELRRRGVDVVLELIGADTPEQGRHELAALGARLGLGDRLRLRGSVAPDDRWDDLLAADVVCLPTDYRAEIMPLTLIDALACGAAVVSTRWRGIGPTLDPCPAAVLVDRPDVGLVADAIADVADRDRAEVRSQARAFFVANLSAERFAQRLASDIGARPA